MMSATPLALSSTISACRSFSNTANGLFFLTPFCPAAAAAAMPATWRCVAALVAPHGAYTVITAAFRCTPACIRPSRTTPAYLPQPRLSFTAFCALALSSGITITEHSPASSCVLRFLGQE